MGYESTLFVVEKRKTVSQMADGTKARDGDVVAMFDLRKAPSISDKMRRFPKTDIHVCVDGIETTKDLYEKPIREIPLSDAIRIIEKAIEGGGRYRRYAPCLSLLKGFDISEWRDLVVLHYGC